MGHGEHQGGLFAGEEQEEVQRGGSVEAQTVEHKFKWVEALFK
jgi:hypothetical protein